MSHTPRMVAMASKSTCAEICLQIFLFVKQQNEMVSKWFVFVFDFCISFGGNFVIGCRGGLKEGSGLLGKVRW
jgi:hypothetical protein